MKLFVVVGELESKNTLIALNEEQKKARIKNKHVNGLFFSEVGHHFSDFLLPVI